MVGLKCSWLRTSCAAACVTAAAAVAALAPEGASAEAKYPAEKIDYILHVKPGGATDVLARKLASALEEEMGVTFVVENRNGGSGAKQMALLTRKDADGATIGAVTASHLGMFIKTGNYTKDDVAWACRVVVDPYILVVPGDSPISDLSDLAKIAKSDPGSLSIAGFGEGSGGQIAWKIIEQAAGLGEGDVKWIPYGSVKEGLIAALGGHNDIAIAYVGLARQHVESGALKVIGIMSDERPELMPQAVPFSEQGFEVDNSWQQFRGIIMPAGTPGKLQAAMCDAVETAMGKPEFKSFLKTSGLNYGFQDPKEFDEFIERQATATSDWFQRLGIGN